MKTAAIRIAGWLIMAYALIATLGYVTANPEQTIFEFLATEWHALLGCFTLLLWGSYLSEYDSESDDYEGW